MVLRGLIAVLAIVSGLSAHADVLKRATAEANEILGFLREYQNDARENPMFACYHLGRLQGVSDRLGRDVTLLEKKAAQMTSVQFENLNLTREYWLGLEKTVFDAVDGKSCDPQAQNRLQQLNKRDLPTAQYVKLAVNSTRTLSSEDSVIGCFYLGRLATITKHLREDITSRARNGKVTSKQIHDTYKMARVAAKAEKACRIAPQKR